MTFCCIQTLAYKYIRDPAAGLIANANLGGDNCHRGSMLGAILGAARCQSASDGRLHSLQIGLPITTRTLVRGFAAFVAKSGAAALQQQLVGTNSAKSGIFVPFANESDGCAT